MKLFAYLKTFSYVALASLAAGCAADTSLGDDEATFYFALMTDYRPQQDISTVVVALTAYGRNGEVIGRCDASTLELTRNANTASPILLGPTRCPVGDDYRGGIELNSWSSPAWLGVSVNNDDVEKTLVVYATRACGVLEASWGCEACGGLGGCVSADCFGGEDADASLCPSNSTCDSDADCSTSTDACEVSRCEHGACVLRQRAVGDGGPC